VTSSQPVTTPNAINFTPDNKHAYAYSGRFTVSTSNQTQLLFNTNTEYINGIFQGHGPISEVTAQNGRISTWKIYFNDEIVAYIKADTTDDFEGTTPNLVKLIIPPFTKVEVITDSNSIDADFYNAFTFTGAVYGMTETGYQ